MEKTKQVAKQNPIVASYQRSHFSGPPHNGTELAEEFNKFFKDVSSSQNCQSLSSTIPRNNRSIYFYPTDEHEVCNIFNSLKNSKSRDIDGIQIIPVKYVLNVIAPLLTYIYNFALSTGCFPKLMQSNCTFQGWR